MEMKLKILLSLIATSAYDKLSEIRNTTSTRFKQKVEHGTMFTLSKNFPTNTKRQWSVRVNQAIAVTRTIWTVMDTISNAHNDNLQFSALYYGYLLNQPITGLQYRLNIFTNKERHIAQCRHEFGALQSRISITRSNITIHIVVPLAGKLQNFKQFLKNLEQRILKEHESISILVVYFAEAGQTEHQKIFQKYKMTYSNSTFTWLRLQGKFARARALQAAVDFYQDNKLMFFADVDLAFNIDFLQRCRDNVVAKKRVYFPVMFKLFNPKILGLKLNATNYFRSFQRDFGDWALHSYGPVCVYREDVISVGGFNVHISEWGYEDIQLFQKFIHREYDVIRVADTGLLHIYHAHVECNVIKNRIQHLMCTGAMLNGLASSKSVVNYLLRKKEL